MSLTPAFEHDLFVSYAHIDNRALVEGGNGWIDKFHYALATRLSQVLGEESKIWRDPKIQGNDYLTDAIRNALPTSAALLSILSPRYLKSDSCMEELREFLKITHHPSRDCLPDKSCIFKVIKTHVPLEQHPPELRDCLGYKFYRIDAKTGRPHELMVDEKDTQFVLYLDDLTYDIAEILGLIRPRPGISGKARTASSEQTVYLAETTSDVEETRDQIRRELRDRGYRILPDRPLPASGKACSETIHNALEQCSLSIHCIGQHYGTVPEGIEQSIVQLQIEVAETCGRNRPLSRLLLLSPDLKAVEPRQEEFLEYLRTKIAGQGADLVVDRVEKFKDIVQERLAAFPKKMVEMPVRSEGCSRIYLMCHHRDFNEVRALQQCLYEEGLEVVLPAMEGDECQVHEDHKENLVWCDAALIYYGNGSEPWFRAKLRDLDKAFGYGKRRSWLAKAVYLAPPKTEPKENLLTRDALVIRGYESESLEPFITQVKHRP